jgi:hypothetical protein
LNFRAHSKSRFVIVAAADEEGIAGFRDPFGDLVNFLAAGDDVLNRGDEILNVADRIGRSIQGRRQ